ncbi:MAG: hypothetical protein IKV36_02370 [Clostridia bacterium]|nr:hypothetical protein [Clostridia bacterium]
MKKQYTNPQIELICYRTDRAIANDNYFSDPWGFEEDLTNLDESEENE